MSDRPRVRVRKGLWVAAGCFSLGLGLIGIVLPLLPTTPFLLLATACFAKGSQRLYDRMLNSPFLGSYIRAYMNGEPLSWRWRVSSILFLWTVILASTIVFVNQWFVQIIMFVVAALVTLHIVTVGKIRVF